MEELIPAETAKKKSKKRYDSSEDIYVEMSADNLNLISAAASKLPRDGLDEVNNSKCFDVCVEKCRNTYQNSEEDYASCAINACKCSSEQIPKFFIPLKPQLFSSRTVNGLIALCFVSFTISVIMLVMVLVKNSKFHREMYINKGENYAESVKLKVNYTNANDLYDYIEKAETNPKLCESAYELIITELDEKEIAMRDF